MTVTSNVKVFGLEDSVKASKYPMSTDIEKLNDNITSTFVKLSQCEKGTGHDQSLTGIIVQFDLTFTIKAWTEAERYHFFDFVSSQSTMHRITKFDLDKTYIKYVDPRMIKIMKEKVEDYNNNPTNEKYLEVLYSNPCGFKLTARMTTNYRQLKTIYSQRKNHRLHEWKEFCNWIETLPYSYLITGKSKEVEEAKERVEDTNDLLNDIYKKYEGYDEYIVYLSSGGVHLQVLTATKDLYEAIAFADHYCAKLCNGIIRKNFGEDFIEYDYGSHVKFCTLECKKLKRK